MSSGQQLLIRVLSSSPRQWSLVISVASGHIDLFGFLDQFERFPRPSVYDFRSGGSNARNEIISITEVGSIVLVVSKSNRSLIVNRSSRHECWRCDSLQMHRPMWRSPHVPSRLWSHFQRRPLPHRLCHRCCWVIEISLFCSCSILILLHSMRSTLSTLLVPWIFLLWSTLPHFHLNRLAPCVTPFVVLTRIRSSSKREFVRFLCSLYLICRFV